MLPLWALLLSKHSLPARFIFLTHRAVEAARAQGLVPVVLTHHAPSLRGTSHPRFAGHPATHSYASDLEPYLYGSGIAAWFCGHTHHNFDMQLQVCAGVPRVFLECFAAVRL